MKTREKEDKKEGTEVIETGRIAEEEAGEEREKGSCENGVFLSTWRRSETKRIPLLGEL